MNLRAPFCRHIFTSPGGRYRWAVASRVLAAAVGGYALTSLINVALPLLFSRLGSDPTPAFLAAGMASFVLYAVIIMAVFCARTATRAWVGLAGAGLLPVLIIAALYQGGRG